MKKRVYSLIAATLVFALIILMPFLLSLFLKDGNVIVLKGAVKGEGENLTEFPVYAAQEDYHGEMVKTLENGRFALYVHERLGTIALLDKQRGRYYDSSPFDLGAAEEEQTVRGEQASQILLTYYEDDTTKKALNSFQDCIAKNQFSIEHDNRQMTMRLTLGQVGEETVCPDQISASAFEAIAGKLAPDEEENLRMLYDRYSLEDVNDIMRKELLAVYPYLEKEDLYVIGPLTKRDKKTCSELFRQAGFTEEDKQKEYEKIGYQRKDELPAFALTVRYTLTDEGLSVAIPMDEVSYNGKYFQVDTITILPYFGCGPADDAAGELLVPDGSGAIMRYNSKGDKRLSSLSVEVYGKDAAATSDFSAVSSNQPVLLPVFGNTSRRGAFLAVITEGESICSITADSGDANNRYASVYASAQYRYNEEYYYDDKEFSKNVMVYADDYNKGDVCITYIPLEDGGNYVNMAEAYRNHLIGKQALKKAEITPRLLLQLLGYGSQGSSPFALTTFDDAQKMIGELTDSGIGRLAVRYLGWTAGGLENKFCNSVSPPRLLGGAGGWEELRRAADGRHVDLYMDMDLAYVRRTSWFDGFSVNGNTCRTIRNRLTGLYAYNFGESDVDMGTLAYAVSASKIEATAPDVLLSFRKKMTGAKISAGSLGHTVNATFKNGDVMTRPEAQKRVQSSLSILADKEKLMLESANAYALAYCGASINIPVTSSGYAALDYDIPFVQLVLNGCVEYCAVPFNEGEAVQDQVLKAIETGASLNYIAAYRNQNRLKSSSQSQYYSVDYNTLKASMKETYEAVARAWEEIGSSTIRSHSYLADNVYKTTFDNGTAVYVNYNTADCQMDGFTIPAKGYRVRKGGDAL